MSHRRLAGGLLLLSLAIVATLGCAMGGGDPSAAPRAKTSERFAATPEEVAAAASRALESLDLTLTTSSATSTGAYVAARSPRDEKIEVRITGDEGESEVRVRVGTFGDAGKSQVILDRIRANLTRRPRDAAPAEPLEMF